MGSTVAAGDGDGRRLCLEWPDLRQPLQSRLRHHWHQVERSALLRFPGRSIDDGGSVMKAPSVRPVRCAIYTRVSTEHGLDQEFNSLDAQYDAASAYIKSQ